MYIGGKTCTLTQLVHLPSLLFQHSHKDSDVDVVRLILRREEAIHRFGETWICRWA